MVIEDDHVLDEINRLLFEVATEGSIRLVEDILIAWGAALVHNRASLPNDVTGTDSMVMRYPAAYMWHELGVIGLERQQDSRQAHSDQRPYVPEVMSSKLTDWAHELARRPFRETIHSFTVLVHEWMQTCNLEQYSRLGFDEQGALASIYRLWGAELGVD